MTAKQYKQQLEAKWGAIQDAYTRDLIARLLDYAKNLEDSQATIGTPQQISHKITTRGNDDSARSFRAQLGLLQPPDADVSTDELFGLLLQNLLEYTEHLEQSQQERS